MAILLVSIVIATMGSDTSANAGDLIWIFVRMLLYLSAALALAWFGLPRVFNAIHRSRYLATGVGAFALIAALLFGWAADALGGIAAITGAFVAGMGLSQTHERVKQEIDDMARIISYSFLVPIFFVNVGLHTDLKEISMDMLPLAVLLVAVAAISKIVGSGAGALLGGFNRGESFRLGVCMISRGEVGLIIASLGLSSGLLPDELFQPVFLVILITTVMTPPLVRMVFNIKDQNSRSAATTSSS